MYLIDTNHATRLVDGSPSVLRAVAAAGAENLFLCSIVAGELLYGAANSARVEENTARFRQLMDTLPVVPVDRAVAECYGTLKHQLYLKFGYGKGRKRPTTEHVGVKESDLWIAAVAGAYNLTLATEDADFQPLAQMGLIRLVNWFDRASG